MRRTAMPNIDDQLRTRMREAAPEPAGDNDLVEHLGARKRRRAGVRRAGTVGLVVVVLVGTSGAFIALGRAFRTEPLPGTLPTPSQTPPDLGLGFPICDVMSMPITVAGTSGNAYVFTKATDGCPKPGEGHRFVGADLDANGTVDATAPELTDCFSPVGCEAFAAPDVNGDGTSEIAVSTAGADGYGVWLYAVTAIPPTVEPVEVELPPGFKGFIPAGPLQFAWVDVVGHFGGAHCVTFDDGSTGFVIDSGDKFGSTADVSSEVFTLEGSIMRALDAGSQTLPLSDLPLPGTTLCGAPLHGSASAFPNAAHMPQTVDIGLNAPLCDSSTLEADFDGDGKQDTAWVGTFLKDGRCPTGDTSAAIVAVDLDRDGLADGSYNTLPRCLLCRTYAATDLNADGADELVVLLQASSTPEYAIYGASSVTRSDSPGMYPMLVSTGNTENGFPDGSQLTFAAGGDEGYSYAVQCEGFPDAPVLMLWHSEHPVEGPGADVTDVYETKLQLVSGSFAVVDARHYAQPTRDPLPFGPASHACGVDWFSLA
jgi:hypothetical protein